MVTAPHASAAQAGVTVLQDGGNAADAIIAVAAVLSVVYPHMTGIGGDAFFLYYDAAGGRIYGYNGSGAAAGLATPERYAGLSSIPERGPLAALTVPGTVDTWFALAERFGSRPMHEILAPAVALAREGAPAARSFAAATQRLRETLASDPAASELFVRDGPAQTGNIWRNPRLGDALEAIGREGRSWLYEGEGARSIDAHATRIGSPLRGADLAAHAGFFCDPIVGSFFGFESLTLPPNSQGLTLLIAQQTYEAYAGSTQPDPGSPAQVHAAVESIRLAITDRDGVVGDPEGPADWKRVLDLDHARVHARRIQPYETLSSLEPALDRGDTSYFACVDDTGNAVSFIQSLFHGFGSGVVVPDLGMLLNNRGTAFELGASGIRRLAPRRRPFHTLMPCMLARAGEPVLVYGSMGGDAQPQIALQISTNIVANGLDPQAAIERPRWRYGKDAPHEPARLHVERRLGEACIAGLRARGHDVEVLGHWEESMGHAGAIWIDREHRVLTGGADPRSDGLALGL